MNVDCRKWIVYADENLAVAHMALEAGYFNACLQNCQQAVEKYLKAALLVQNATFHKTHSVEMLNQQLQKFGFNTDLVIADCELLDSIYIPSKYPVGSALPDFNPDHEISEQCLEIVERVREKLSQALQ